MIVTEYKIILFSLYVNKMVSLKYKKEIMIYICPYKNMNDYHRYLFGVIIIDELYLMKTEWK